MRRHTYPGLTSRSHVARRKKEVPLDRASHKPGSVENGHSSGPCVTTRLKQPTRERRGPRHDSPIWPCCGWGLPSREMLPLARCALTAPFHHHRTRPEGRFLGCLLSVALSVGSRLPGVTWHPALCSPDFPPSRSKLRNSDRLSGADPAEVAAWGLRRSPSRLAAVAGGVRS